MTICPFCGNETHGVPLTPAHYVVLSDVGRGKKLRRVGKNCFWVENGIITEVRTEIVDRLIQDELLVSVPMHLVFEVTLTEKGHRLLEERRKI